MKNKLLLLLIILFVNNLVSGQIFCDLDNSNHELYSILKVKSLKMLTNKYENGKLTNNNVELIQTFSENGYIIQEEEFHKLDSTKNWRAQYKYNNRYQVLTVEWDWKDSEKELTKYQYNKDNKLTKECNYVRDKGENDFYLDECILYFYKKNQLDKITDSDKELMYYLKKKKNMLYLYSEDDEIVREYKNGILVKQRLDDTIIEYKRNKTGKILTMIKTDDDNKIISKTYYQYVDELLRKIITKDADDNLLEEIVYEYIFS